MSSDESSDEEYDSKNIVDSSEEEEEEDEEEAEDMGDLINDEEEDEEEDDDAGTKRSRDDDDDEDVSSSLDEEDMILLKEHGIEHQQRKKKFKRIKIVASDDDSEEENENEAEKIRRTLFGPSELLGSDDEEDQVNKRPKPTDLDLNLDSDEEESDGDDDFIVDDDTDQPIKKTKKKGVKYSDAALEEAIETFGVDFDYSDVEDDYEDGYENDYEDEEDVEDEETGEVRPKRKKGGRKTIYDIYEPAELERSHMTSFDQQVRAKDEPERFQLRQVPVTEADDQELEQEAAWIFKCAFGQTTISLQEKGNDPIAGRRSEVIIPEIRYALNCIRNEKLEVSFIAAYRREYVPSISSNFDDTRDLWTIYRYDEQWCKFNSSKKSLINLYKNMQTYLETITGSVKFRQISDYEFKCVEGASNFYEIDDCRLHFQLYYSSFVPEMKLYFLKKKIDEKKAADIDNDTTEGMRSTESIQENGEDENNDENQRQPRDQQTTEEENLYKKLSKFKISSNDLYRRCYQEGLDDVVSKFGLTAEQLGENLREDYQRNNVVQCSRRPLDAASDAMQNTSRFPSREACLKAATYMFAREVASDPMVRQVIRRNYFDNAVINVKPTAIGMKEIDENHPCYAIKFLKNKPATRLEGEQILHLLNAERDKLLEVKFTIEAVEPSHSHISPYHESLKALYFSDFSSIVTKEWNDQREEAIRISTSKFLLPSFEKQLRERLVKEAQEKIIKICCEKLHNWLNVAPYAPAPGFDDHEDFELRNGTRICGFTFSPDGEVPCFAAIIDSEGELVDHVRLPYLNMRKRHDRMTAIERENHAKDRHKFKEFMINRKPHAVALAAETIQTKYICQDLAQILDELREHDGLPLIPIEIVDNELSNVYMNLKRATDEFPDFPPLLLQAISNARKLNDPLTEYAKLCTADEDITCLRFHSLQDELPREEFLDCLYQRFVTRTNAVGIDPNRAIAHPHTADIVQFVAGLGPRKATHLLRSIKKLSTSGQLVSRQQLVRELGMTGVIFLNCAGFIKLDTDTLSEDFPDEHITPLDSTRIHPESYGLAKKIASDALDYEDDASDETTANAIEEILENPEKLDDLDLNAFARELDQVQNEGKKGYTLQSIREEFQVRYKDHRESYKAPSQEEIFAMLTKETPRTFYIGKLITCQVVQIIRKKPVASQLDMANPVKIDETNLWRCPFCMRSDFQDLSVVWNHFDTDDCPGYAIGVKCKLDNGLFGFVPTKFLSDSEIMDPSERVGNNQIIHARIIKIDTDKFSCDLTCRSSDLIDEAGKLKPIKDEYYDENAEKEAKREQEIKSKRAARKPYCKRVIVHPAFENIDYKVCEKKLQQMEQGCAIIRPSSAGQNFLTVSWKVTDGINQHINIREEGKTQAFSLGQQLFIENESYEDLDEIIARYVQPMASFARELLNYKYCIPLKEGVEEKQLIQDALLIAKSNTQCFPYRFCPSRELPGKFLLGYLPKNKPKIEYLTVTPRGYRFRGQYFKNLAVLIKWFKENWNRLPPQIYPGITPGMTGSLRQTFPMSQ